MTRSSIVAAHSLRDRVGSVLGRFGRTLRERARGPALVPALGVLGLATLAVVLFKQQLFDHWTFPWDFVGAYTTTPAFVASSVGSGHLLSWSPFVASGFPVDVDPQSGLYFPGWWLLGVLGTPATLRVLTAVQVAHVLVGSVGMLMLARVRLLAWPWAILAAVAYMLFGGFYGEAEHADIVRGFAYLPWLLWALTPPAGAAQWTRLVAVPLLAWLIASGAYPGQLASFGLTGLVYMGMALRGEDRKAWRKHRTALLLVVAASGAACLAVLLPYLRAEQAHELYRALEPTASVRATESLGPRDFLGLYLNNFAWTYDGTVTSWAVGIPILMGLACLRWQTVRRHAPLALCGVIALALAMTPKIGFIGRMMAALRPLFPSRFPAAEYKAVVAIALVLLAADAWSQLSARRRGLEWRAMALGVLIVLGALLAPSTYGPPTRALWLVIAVAVVSVALVLVRLPKSLLICVLIGLVVVDGVRETYDYRLLGAISPWRASAAEAAPYRERDGYIRKLPTLLKQAPATRPARVGPYASLVKAPTGSDPDATGWIADGYHLIDYGSTVERALWRVEHNPVWLALMLAPWHAYTFSCSAVGCADHEVHLPSATTWHAASGVHTLSYGPGDIVYSVDVAQPELMVENELAISGWHANTSKVTPVDTGLPLRAWRLSPGRYIFTASYQERGRIAQGAVAFVGLLLWLASIFTVRRKRDIGIVGSTG